MWEREKERYIDRKSKIHKSGDLAGTPDLCPDWSRSSEFSVCRLALSPLSHTSQGSNPLTISTSLLI